MPHALKFRTTVQEGGRLPKYRQKSIRSYLELCEGQEIEIRLGKPKRTTKANAFYWVGVIAPIQAAAAEAGEAVSAQALHEYFKAKYLPPATVGFCGDEVLIPPTTTQLDSTQFYDFIESVRTDDVVLQLGVVFDEPEGLRSFSIDDLPV